MTLTPEQDAAVRAIVASMLKQALGGADARIRSHQAVHRDAATLVVEPAAETFTAAAAALASFKKVADAAVEVADIGVELAGIDPADLVTLRADDLLFSLEPTQRCFDLVAAIAARNFDGFAIEVETRHGWPILSVVGSSTTVAEAGGASSVAGGGQAA